jgi:hypothetical protein
MLMAPSKTLTADVRQFLSRHLIERAVRGLEIGNVFRQSQSWEGYNRAWDSWHSAFWKWIDDTTPAKTTQKWKTFQFNWSKISPADIINGLRTRGLPLTVAENEKTQWAEEYFRQSAFQRLLIFQTAMRGPEARDPKTIDSAAWDILIASQIGDTAYSERLAKQQQRKPTKNKGDRRLKPQLLLYWIPGCLWAFTNDGIAAFLNDLYPRSGKVASRSQVISNAHRNLKLHHSPTPSYWGVTGSPTHLVSL